MNDSIRAFLDGTPFAVVGASRNREKYGNKVLRAYWQHGRVAYPVHPVETLIEGQAVYRDLRSIPTAVHGVSIITPPTVTEQVVEEAIELGIRHLWMQPGAESDRAIERAEAHGLNVIARGPCLLVVLGYDDSR